MLGSIFHGVFCFLTILYTLIKFSVTITMIYTGLKQNKIHLINSKWRIQDDR